MSINDSMNEMEDFPLTLSSHLFRQLSVFSDGNVAVETKMETATYLEPFLDSDDAYISFTGESNQAHLPALTNWNGSSGLRKGYTLLMWIRPKLMLSNEQKSTTVDGGRTIDDKVNEESKETSQRILYRFSTSTEDSSGTGICVVCSQWKAVPLDEEKIERDVGYSSTYNRSAAPRRQLETMLTAYTLPSYKPNQVSASGISTRSSYVQQPLILEVDKWQLLGFSHSNPYLKPAVWAVTVNGRLLGSDNLPYPVLPENHHVNSMEYCSMLQNITSSGAILTIAPNDDDKPDYEKTATQLQAESNDSETSILNSRYHQNIDLRIDVAAISLYADKSIPLACLAVAADAGPSLALQKGGRILPTLPPVANWTKGASLEGPKVGIPLAVHSSALSLQQLSSAPNLVFCCSAVSAKVLGSPGLKSTRLVCPMQLQPGLTITPRVGLIQPVAPLRIPDDELPCLYVVGNVQLYHAVSHFLLSSSDDVGEQISSNIDYMTKNMSVALLEQEILSTLIQPFFRSLCPPGKLFDLHYNLYNQSLKNLHALYTNEAAYAAKLIRLFTIGIRHGGGRAHEEVLQSGLIHVFASSLRLSLLRAYRLKLFQDNVPNNPNDFAAKIQKNYPDETSVAPPQHGVGASPLFIPASITEACCELIDACCGPPQTFLENLSPHYRIRRTSDLALTAIFGLALDMDLWGGYPTAACKVFESVVQRYGATCVTSGFVMRSQVSIQHFLDVMRLQLDDKTYSQEAPGSIELESTALSLSKLLQSMLLSSLSNVRSVSQGEHDVSACVGALCDCPLGSVSAHVILNAFVGILAWCDILPIETTITASSRSLQEIVHEQDKLQVASRLGRNILMAQFHDVIAPMILSRTVFSGERVATASKVLSEPSSNRCAQGAICWQIHWRLSLLLFSWVASIAGPEGLLATKFCGNLLLASSRAGSLEGALDESDKNFVSTLFLPSPTMSLLIGSSLRNEWSYSDLLSDRLDIMVPLLPGLIVALLSHLPRSIGDGDSTKQISSSKTLSAMSVILTSVGGAFHRVFGGVIHFSSISNNASMQGMQSNKRSGAVSGTIRAAKAHSPHLLMVVLALEDYSQCHISTQKDQEFVSILQCRSSDENLENKDSVESWIDVASTSSETLLNEIAVALPGNETVNNDDLFFFLKSCQRSVINTVAGLISNAMDVGGSGAANPLWQSLLATIQQSTMNCGISKSVDEQSGTRCSTDDDDTSKVFQLSNSTAGMEKSCFKLNQVAHKVLCRLTSQVMFKALKRTRPRDLWSYELSSSVARLCTLIEETALLTQSKIGQLQQITDEQIVLMCVILDLLSYGRESAGWCQVIPTTTSLSSNEQYPTYISTDTMTASSKILLPVLIPSLRIILCCVSLISCSIYVLIPKGNTTQKELLLPLFMTELSHTLTAAIVGLSFSGARNVALFAMATIRKVLNSQEHNGDDIGTALSRSLLIKVAEELRVRYENERHLRDRSLFDAYDGDDNEVVKQDALKASQVIERLIIGEDLFQSQNVEAHGSDLFPNEDINFIGGNGSEDFILFHEPDVSNENGIIDVGKLGSVFLKGLGAALQTWKGSYKDNEIESGSRELLSIVSVYLDALDVASDKMTVDDKLVKSFDNLQLNNETLITNNFTSQGLVIDGSDTAAEAMSTFFEFAATEKNRLKEISSRFLPTHRYSRMAFTDRFCWARHMESTLGLEELWERGVSDGNRDIRSRIPTIPCFPQFRRFLPKYLDNSPVRDTSLRGEELVESDRRSSIANEEFGAFTKSLLETGHLEIIDITKKQVEDEEEIEIPLTVAPLDTLDEDDTALFSESDARAHGSSSQDTENENAVKVIVEVTPDSVDEESSHKESLHDEELAMFPTDLLGKGQHNITTSSFSSPPDNSSSSLSLLHSALKSMIEQHVENCVHVKAEGNRQCTMLLTSSHLILEYDGNPDGLFEGEILALQEDADRQKMVEDVGGSQQKAGDDVYQQKLSRRNRELAALRPKSIRWNLTEVSHVYLRRYRLRDTALEIFFIPSGATSFGGYGVFSPSSSLYIDFGPGYEGIARRDEAAFAIMNRSPKQAMKQWPDRSEQFLHEQLNRLAVGWVEGRITNFDYLLHLNMLSGRSYNDICQYPVFPWVLSDYTSEEIPDLTNKNSYRDLTKPVGALNADRLQDFLDRFNTFADPCIPAFMYGSHYSTSAGVVLHFLVRLHPYAGLHRQLQGGHFDVADRLFSSVPRTWSMCTGSSAAEVKELTPEWYCNPTFLRNVNKFKLGTSQDGEVIDDVHLPPWAKGSPERFVEVMRAALESDICSEMLSSWIDLIFGKKQQGPAAKEANNVFFYLTYYGTVDVASIEDESLRHATELQIAHFGQCPMQLFRRIHVRRLPKSYHYLSLYQILSSYSQRVDDASKLSGLPLGGETSQISERSRLQSIFGEPMFLPFLSAPISHCVHLDAPPPGPHAAMIAVRFAGVDRCLAVDAKGVFHSIRWAWRAEEPPTENISRSQNHFDLGCFVAQRELPRFRSVPRLMYTPSEDTAVVAISKTLFAGRTVLLVLSDGDGCGSLCMQLVDPAKGEIRGEVLIPHIHAARISCITTDPIGTAAGHGGLGGELCLVGSEDGNASMWRFMSSHYLPLRPRVKLRGHCGNKVSAVALCSSLHLAVTLSTKKCCLYSIGNGALIRSFGPPIDALDMQSNSDLQLHTCFADTPALAISVQGLIVTVCETTIKSTLSSDRIVITLNIFTVEGVQLGSKPLESWRGVPHRMHCTPDGTALLVCCGRGVTMHRLSACQPLIFLDEFQVSESDELDGENSLPSAWDIDLGPTLNRPVVAAAACSNGVLRLHALPGISAWSERHRKSGLTLTVGNVLAKPARRLNKAVRDGLGLGRHIAGIGRDLTQEVSSDVKERGVGVLFGSMFSRNSSK